MGTLLIKCFILRCPYPASRSLRVWYTPRPALGARVQDLGPRGLWDADTRQEEGTRMTASPTTFGEKKGGDILTTVNSQNRGL